MNLKAWALALVKPLLRAWLSSRALVIPDVKAQEIATKFGVPVEAVKAVDAAAIEQSLAQFDSIKF